MKVFITGIAGFLGSHLADAFLAKGWQVAGCDNLIGGYRDNIPDGVDFHEVDCANLGVMKKIMRGADVVYHCAATAYEGLSVFSPTLVTHHIVMASVATMTAAIKNDVKRFIYCSSMARYGTNEVPFREDMTPRPQDPYGIGKYAGELLLRNLAETHGMEYVIVVPHNIIGPRQRYDDPYRNVASIMINFMLRGEQPFVYGDGGQKRCFSFVQDDIKVLFALATAPNVTGEVINVGPDEEFITINQLASTIAKIIGFDLRPIYLPERPNEVRLANCSADKARRLLGYHTEYTLEQGLRTMIEHVSARGPKPFTHHLSLEIKNQRTPRPWYRLPRRLHFFTKAGYEAASSRPRAFHVAEELKKKNFFVDFDAVMHGAPTHYRRAELLTAKRWTEFFRHARKFAAMGRDDVLFLQRTIYQVEFVLLVLFFRLVFKRRYLFDFDDAVFLHSPKKTRLMVRFASAVLAGSHYLYDYAKPINEDTFLVPTSVDLGRFKWQEPQSQAPSEVVIGWSGDAMAHQENLALLRPVFEKLAAKRNDFIFYLLGAKGDPKTYELFNIPGLKTKFVDYVKPDEVPAVVATFDIGLMPLEDTLFARGKCALKIIEYFAMKKPAVASPVGENTYAITAGSDGFLPATTEEWVEALEKLIDDRALRARMGECGYQKVLREYSLHAVTHKILDVLTLI